MGKLRFYTCGKYGLMNLTANSLNGESKKTISISWKSIGGFSRNVLFVSGSTSNSVLGGGSIYATTETEQTFNESNYNYTAVSGVTLSVQSSGDTVNVSDGKAYRTISVTLKNTGSSSATVPSVTKAGYFNYSTGSSDYDQALSWCYIFDTPITLNAGETKTVVFNFGYKLPTNND